MRTGGIAYLSWKYLGYRPLRTLMLVAAVALTVYLPLALQLFTSETTRILQQRARSTPLLIGPKGSSIDLTLNSLYFTPQALPPLPHSAFGELRTQGLGDAIPMHIRFRAGEAPIVGTSLAYFHHRNLELADGHMLTRLGDCVVGAALAKERGLAPGDKITSSPENVFDLAGVYPLRMRVTGVLAPRHTPDDEAVFVDLKTAWIIEGLAHGHQDLAKPEAAPAVRARDGNAIQANASVLEYNEVTDDNIDSFHFHGDPAAFPLSSIILVPDSDKSRALALARYQREDAAEQIVIPLEAVTNLTETLFATRKLILAALTLLGLAALALAALVFLLSFRMREREMLTYRKIGASRAFIAALKGSEVAIVLAAGILLAVAALLLTRPLAADLLPRLLN